MSRTGKARAMRIRSGWVGKLAGTEIRSGAYMFGFGLKLTASSVPNPRAIKQMDSAVNRLSITKSKISSTLFSIQSHPDALESHLPR